MTLPQQKRKRIGEMLIAEGLLTPEQLEAALEEQRRHGGRIGAILKSLGFVTEEGIIKTLGRQTGIPHQVLSTVIIDPDVIKLVPELLARRHQAIPLYKKGIALTLAMVDPLNVVALDDIGRDRANEREMRRGRDAAAVAVRSRPATRLRWSRRGAGRSPRRSPW